MPIFKIEPLQTTTQGGYTATITGINTGSTDFIAGTVQGEAMTVSVSWDGSGICRDNSSDFNLNTQTNEFIEVLEACKSILT